MSFFPQSTQSPESSGDSPVFESFATRTKLVRSESDGSQIYRVTVCQEHPVLSHCTCKSFMTHQHQIGYECKHIRDLMEELGTFDVSAFEPKEQMALASAWFTVKGLPLDPAFPIRKIAMPDHYELVNRYREKYGESATAKIAEMGRERILAGEWEDA